MNSEDFPLKRFLFLICSSLLLQLELVKVLIQIILDYVMSKKKKHKLNNCKIVRASHFFGRKIKILQFSGKMKSIAMMGFWQQFWVSFFVVAFCLILCLIQVYTKHKHKSLLEHFFLFHLPHIKFLTLNLPCCPNIVQSIICIFPYFSSSDYTVA